MVEFVLPTMLRTRPTITSTWSSRKWMAVKMGLEFALMESTLDFGQQLKHSPEYGDVQSTQHPESC
jgi:hypothetical protein